MYMWDFLLVLDHLPATVNKGTCVFPSFVFVHRYMLALFYQGDICIQIFAYRL